MTEVLTVEAVAERLACHPRTIRRAIERGDLVASDIGSGKRSAWRIREEDLAAWLEQTRNRPRTASVAQVLPSIAAAARPPRPRRGGRLEVTAGMGR